MTSAVVTVSHANPHANETHFTRAWLTGGRVMTVPGPPASVLAAILRADANHPYTATVPTQRRTATFTTSAAFPDLPSLTDEVVFLPQNAILDANLQVTGTLASQGFGTQGVVTVTANYTPSQADAEIRCNAAAGAFTITLPDATQPGFINPGQRYTVKKTDSSSNTVTLAASAGQTIDGAATQAITPSQSAISVIFTGSGWDVTSGGSAIGTNAIGGVVVSGTPSTGQVLTATGTGTATWEAGGFTSPMTTLGDIIYENSTPAAARLAGNTSTTKQFLTQTGTGTVSAAPAWGTIAVGDLPPGSAGQSLTTLSTGTVAWKNAPVDWLNVVTQYGADPTGVADSTTAIQGALNAVPSGGGTVYIPDGIYLITSSLTFSVSGTKVLGAGWGSQIRYDGTVVTAGAFKMVDTTTRRCNISWIRISQTNASAAGTAIEASYFVDSAIEHVLIDAGGSGVAPLIGISFNSSTTFYNLVSDCRVNCSGANSIGIRFDGGANSNVARNCRIIPDGAVSSSIGVYVNAKSIDLDHVDIENSAGTGISVGATGHACTIIAPYLEANGTNLLLASGANAPTVISGTVEAGTTADITDNGALTPMFLNLRSSSGGEHAYTKAAVTNLFQPSDQGLIAWTYDPISATNTSAPSLGVVQLVKVPLRYATTVSNVLLQLTATGTLTTSQNFAGLYNSGGTLLSSTADQTTAWGSTGLKTMALTAAQTVLPGYYYIGFVVNGSAACAFARGNGNAGASTTINAGLAAATYRFATGPSGTSLPTTITMSSNSAASVPFWGAVS